MANNPLARANSIGFQNYYAPSLFGLPGQSVNTLMIRPVVVTPRLIIRASVPLMTVPTVKSQPLSGLGDINIFATYVWFFPKSYTDFGIGPIVVLPSATDSVLGAGKYQLGVAAVLVQPLSKTVLLGSLITWQASVYSANEAAEKRPSTSLLNFQPFYVFQIGGGFTLKGTAVWMFDFTNGHYAIPLGFDLFRTLFPLDENDWLVNRESGLFHGTNVNHPLEIQEWVDHFHLIKPNRAPQIMDYINTL